MLFETYQTEKITAGIVIGCNSKLGLKLLARLRILLCALHDIRQAKIGMRVRMSRIERERLLEFTDCELGIAGLAVRPADQHMQLRRGAQGCLHLVEQNRRFG